MYCIAQMDRKDIYSPRPVFLSAIFQDCLSPPLTDAVIICRFRSVVVVVCLCFLGKKQGYDHPPAVSPFVLCFFISLFFYIYVYLGEGVPDKDLSSALTI